MSYYLTGLTYKSSILHERYHSKKKFEKKRKKKDFLFWSLILFFAIINILSWWRHPYSIGKSHIKCQSNECLMLTFSYSFKWARPNFVYLGTETIFRQLFFHQLFRIFVLSLNDKIASNSTVSQETASCNSSLSLFQDISSLNCFLSYLDLSARVSFPFTTCWKVLFVKLCTAQQSVILGM